jgi:hypothetical protein
MTRPVFEEPSESAERSDPWSGPKGFMIGGMSHPRLQDLGQQYFDAAYLLTEAIKRGDHEDYKLSNPVLFLYRHSIELFLKSYMVKAEKKHGLEKLAQNFTEYMKREYAADIPSWINARIKEVAAIDPTSTAFRYGVTYDRDLKLDVRVPGETYVSLPHLQQAMLALNTALAGTIPEIARYDVERAADEAEEDQDDGFGN